MTIISNEEHSIKILIFCKMINDFTVTLDKFNISWLNKSIKFIFLNLL